MPSQKSIPPPLAREPKRQRGKVRVAVLLDAAAALFAQKGFDGATMTEIATAAKTAIGSLYQFFPNKEILADAVLVRYGERIQAGLRQIEGRAVLLGPAGLADAFIDLMLELRTDRASAIALLDVRDAAGLSRSALREAMLAHLGASLLAVDPTLPPAKAALMAVILLQSLKAIPVLATEAESTGADLVGEAREMMRLYVVQGLAGSASSTPRQRA
jgi:AcrR family transcriptional regulator